MTSTRMVAIVVLAALVVAGLAGCGPAAEKADPAALEGVEWSLREASGISADLAQIGITARFDGTTVAGFSGVNQYSGPYTAGTDGSFEVGQIAGTLMAGPEPQMAAEKAYLDALAKCDSFAVADGVLTLSVEGKPALTYEEAKPAALPGTSWVVTNYNNGKEAVTSPIAGSELTLQFGTDGTVSGSGGVNTFNGPFEATDKTVKIGPLASTMMAGSQELMDQEAQYFAALEAATTWELVQGKLWMRDDAGAAQVVGTPATE